MKKILLIALAATVMTACDNNGGREKAAKPVVELELDRTEINIGEADTDFVSFRDIAGKEVNDNLRIVSGNGGYTLEQTSFTADYLPESEIVTSASVVDGSFVVVTIKGPSVEEAAGNARKVACYDTYLLTDSEGKEVEVNIRDAYHTGDCPL